MNTRGRNTGRAPVGVATFMGMDMTNTQEQRDRYLETLERLLAIQATALTDVLDQASQRVTETLGADKIGVFLHETSPEALVAAGVSDTPMGRREREIGLDRFPLDAGGRPVEVFRTGAPYATGQADQDPAMDRLTQGLGVRSAMLTPLMVNGASRGVVEALSAQPDQFSAEDQRFLEAVSSWLGLMVHRAELAEVARLMDLDHLRADFIAMVSHNLQTPLTAVRLGVGLLQTGASGQLGPNEQRLLQDVHDNVERLRVRITDLLTVNEMDAGALRLERAPLDLRTVITQAVTVVGPLLQDKGQELELDFPRPLPLVGDARLLEQVALNLLSNAQRHTPPGTRVVVSGQITDREVRLTVRDNGPGIPVEELERVFGRFYRLDTPAGGSGLGLAVARAIVELHGGRVWAESQEEGGAVFLVALPRDGVGGEQL